MTDDPMELLTETVPALFNGAMEDLKAEADGGDAAAQARLEEAMANQMAVLIKLEGDDGGSVYIVTDKGKTVAQEQAPSFDVKVAMAMPYEAVQIALEEMGDLLEKALPKARKRISRASASKGMAMLPDEPLRFHSVLKDTPDFDEVRTKITIGAGDIAEEPTFTVIMDYDTFEDMRAGKVKPQQMMSRVQMEGDTARAMQIGMEMAQRMAPRS